MNLTKEQIEALRENPIAQLLFSLFDEVEVDKPVQEEKKVIEKTPVMPKMTAADYAYISNAAKNFNKCLLTARQIGLVPNTKDMTLVGSLIIIIYALIRIYIGQEFANKFVYGLCTNELTTDYFTEIYNDTIRNS